MKLVLLPGLDGTGELFARFANAMPDVDVLVIAYPTDRPMTYDEHVAFARPLLPAGGRYVLLGESFSGPVAISLAAAAPAGLAALILCCSFAANPLPMFGPMSALLGALPAIKLPASWFAPLLYAGHATPDLRLAHSQAMARVSAPTLRARVSAVLGVDRREELRRVAVPLLYLRATADRLIPHSALRTIEQIRPDLRVAEFDAPHFLLQTRPDACAAAVRQFLLACS